MHRDVLTQHATDCRQLAGEYASEERDFLLHIASEFDRLAERDREEGPPPWSFESLARGSQ